MVAIAALWISGQPMLGAQADETVAGIHIVHVQGNVWMLVTPDGNLALQVGSEGALLVDTGRGGTSDAVLAAIRRITPLPLRYIVNTSAGPTEVGNNGVLGGLKGGATDRRGPGPPPAIIGQENVVAHLSMPGADGNPAFPAVSWPTDPYAGRKRSIRYNGEAIDIIHQPNAYSDADSIVYFRRSDVIVSGEIFSTKRFPLVDRAHGGTVTGVLAGLNTMLDIAVPAVIVESFDEDGTLIIPGSGRLCDKDDLTEYRDMVQIARDRMVNLVSSRRSLDEIKAGHPLVDYEGRYSVPEWTTSMFVDALYAELSRPKTANGPAATDR
jgi:cyclase